MTDNRTNEPTPEQVEAAAKALEKLPLNLITRVEALDAARAALVAAQGAAPQAKALPESSYISPSLPGMIRNLWKSDPSENSVRTALKLAGDLIQELIDLRAATVQPSSTVDEGKLAEVLKAHQCNYGDCLCGEQIDGTTLEDHQARAVVEAIGGVAPQAESALKSSASVITRGVDSDCARGICPSGCSHLMWSCDTCSCEGGWGATRGKLKQWATEHVCPAQPSSTVDEEKIAEVIAKANYDWSKQRLEFWRRPSFVEPPGDLDQFTARAVVEAIGGEGL